MIKYWTISKYFRSLDFGVSLIVRQCLQYFSRCPLKAYKKLRGTQPNVCSASADPWLANHYMSLFFSIEDQWEVECIGIESDPKKCRIQLEEKIIIEFEQPQSSPEIKTDSDFQGSRSKEKRSDRLSKFNRKNLVAVGVGVIGIALLPSALWILGLICIGIAWLLFWAGSTHWRQMLGQLGTSINTNLIENDYDIKGVSGSSDAQ